MTYFPIVSRISAIALVALLSANHLSVAADAVVAATTSSKETAVAPMTTLERSVVITSLATNLEDRYIFPEIGKKYAQILRNYLATGKYDAIGDPRVFATTVTGDLQAVSADGHLKIRLTADMKAAIANFGSALGAERMIDGVVYLQFNFFPADDAVAKEVHAFLLAHTDAKAVIIDSRNNHGGNGQFMDTILPLFYAKPMNLLAMDVREHTEDSDKIAHYDRDVAPDGTETRLQNVPIYYLTSKKTYSAAEVMALALKRTHRATLVGETTGGADHRGEIFSEGERFSAFVPIGRTYDPVTNWDWETVGVAPNVAIPAEQALDAALKLAKGEG